MGCIMYMMALTLQLTAGAMLLLGAMGISKKKIVSNYCTQHRAIEVYPNGDLKDYDEFIEVAKNSWMNWLAFLLLFLGYLLSIFGESPENKWLTLGLVMISTVVLLSILNFSTSVISKKYGKVNFNEFILNKGSMAFEVNEDREEMLKKDN